MSASESTAAIAAKERSRSWLADAVSDRKIVYVDRIEWGAAIILSLGALLLFIVRTVHAGPLWRDECDSLQLATMPRFGDLLAHLHFTAFPLLFPAVVRAYTALFGTTDIVLRCFGLVVGILFLGVSWFQSWSLHRKVPLLLPALIGLNINFLTAGLWLRGYGLGCVLIVLAFALTTNFLLQPSALRLMAVFLAYLASMQCLFFNGVLVPAMVLAATAVLIVRREWKWMWLLLGIAAVCGLSYLPYIWKIYASTSTWAVVVQGTGSLRFTVREFVLACGDPYLVVAIAWRSIVLLCVVAGIWRLKVVWNTDRTRERDMLLFGLLAIPTSILLYCGFLQVMQSMPGQRYFLALVCLIAAAATLIATNISSAYWLYFGRIALVLLAMVTLPGAPWTAIVQRQSSMDTVAQRLEKEARPNDLIVVNQWSLGISFNHYYHGTNRWITVPQIDDHRVHRYDLIQKKMMELFPLDDVEQDIAATLKSGNRVWIVGRFITQPSRKYPIVLTPAPDPKYGWLGGTYAYAWSENLGVFLRRHAGRVDVIVRPGKSVSDSENPQLIACEGWRY